MKCKAVIISTILFLIAAIGMSAEETLMAGVHDFGDIGRLAEFNHTFKIKNETGEEFRIEHFDISCPCVQILTYPDSIKAGESGEIKIRFYPYGDGRVRRTVHVITDSPVVKRYKLIIKANFTEELKYPLKEVDGVRIASEVLMRREKVRSKGKYITVKAAQERLKGSVKPVIIDVREQLSYSSYNIAGSINMPLYMVKTKSFLRSKDLIVVSEGYNSATLEAEADSLKRAGYRVSILKGGINSWIRGGGELFTSPASRLEGSLITGEELYKERDYNDLVIIDLSKERADNSYYLPTSKHLPFNSADDLKRALNSYKEKIVIIVNEEGQGYEKIEAALKGASLNNLFYLVGGMAEYRQFLKRQTQLIYPADSVKTQRKKKCGSCP